MHRRDRRVLDDVQGEVLREADGPHLRRQGWRRRKVPAKVQGTCHVFCFGQYTVVRRLRVEKLLCLGVRRQCALRGRKLREGLRRRVLYAQGQVHVSYCISRQTALFKDVCVKHFFLSVWFEERGRALICKGRQKLVKERLILEDCGRRII